MKVALTKQPEATEPDASKSGGGGFHESVPKKAPLLVDAREACRLLGGVCRRTLLRWEQRGFIRSVPLTRHKLYRLKDVERLVEEVAL